MEGVQLSRAVLNDPILHVTLSRDDISGAWIERRRSLTILRDEKVRCDPPM